MTPARGQNRAWMRASDRDREQALAVLRRRCAEGYISVDTFERRVERTFAARTVAELRSVVADVTAERSWLREGVARFRRSGLPRVPAVAGRPSRRRPDPRGAQPPLRRRRRGPDRVAPASRAAPRGRGRVARHRRRLPQRHLAPEPPRRADDRRPRRRALARLLPGPAGLSSPRGRAKATAIAVVVLVLAAAAAALSGGRQGGPAEVAVDTGAPGRAVPAPFLGLSMEWTSVAPYGGPARPAIVALLRRLEAAAGAPLPLRIGGASGEESWWNPSDRGPRPPGVRHDIDPATLAALAGLARGLDAPVTMGLNLQDGDDRNALALARAAQRRLGGAARRPRDRQRARPLHGRPHLRPARRPAPAQARALHARRLRPRRRPLPRRARRRPARAVASAPRHRGLRRAARPGRRRCRGSSRATPARSGRSPRTATG